MKQVLLFLLVLGCAYTLSAEEVTFMVNMNYQMELGNFDPVVDFVDVAGNFTEWAGSEPMSDDNEDGIYAITVPDLEIGYVCQYKFRINGSWDNAEFPDGGANRMYTVVEGENIVEHWFNDQMPPMGDPAIITFIVDDSAGMLYDGFYLKGSWDANGVYDAGWGGGIEHTPFYDDGTNGDAVAGDNIWTVQVELYPDNGTHTWQWGFNDSEQNWIAGNFEFQVIDDTPQTLSHTILSLTEMDVTVTFQVDMSFLQNVEEVFIGGDLNEWNASANPMSDDEMNEIFTADIVFPAGSNRHQEYKFINGEEWESINNRSFEIDDTGSLQILDVVYFNNQSPDDFIAQDVTVTFQLNMINVAEVGIVTIAGDFNGWNNIDDILTDENENMIYTIDILFEAGSYRYQEYKYLNDGEYEDGYNRLLEIDDTASTQVLPVVYFGDDSSEQNETLVPNAVSAFGNYPNPFNPTTTIKFTISQPEEIEVTIYNAKGQKVTSLVNKQFTAGTHEIVWDGKDKQGNTVASGLYFSVLQTHRETLSQKMILLK